MRKPDWNVNLSDRIIIVAAVAVILLAATLQAHADCQHYSVIGGRYDHQANIRRSPSFNSSVESILNAYGYGSGPGSLTWCGRTVGSEGVTWYWVSFHVSRDTYLHSGWVSSNMISYYGETTVTRTAPSPAAPSSDNTNQNQNVINNYVVVPRQ